MRKNILITTFLIYCFVNGCSSNSKFYNENKNHLPILDIIGICVHIINAQKNFYEVEDTTYFKILTLTKSYNAEKLFYNQFLEVNFTNIEFNVENIRINIMNDNNDTITISNLNYNFTTPDSLTLSNISIEGRVPEVIFSNSCCNVGIHYVGSIIAVPKNQKNSVLIQKQHYNYSITLDKQEIKEVQLNLD
ncbi:MAG TPA: hypothetical protein PK073_04115 [Ignavibacteriaceae bacterium]|jgi:hypothetical protein|nr:MAG: hypothetical protein BWY38_01043 [Ignavibacteria bacterium ADurb.Bin266]OQY75435.1 MAG: hypothetical protein B6D44_01645 [Ignavibacteriales bacterium UTCHB2]HQF42077.1 hypothetical protein [Ignavibacteriaceae bacterium]HQI39930.1 hypothetical protein [Ignavibacteriaceae bacterium]